LLRFQSNDDSYLTKRMDEQQVVDNKGRDKTRNEIRVEDDNLNDGKLP